MKFMYIWLVYVEHVWMICKNTTSIFQCKTIIICDFYEWLVVTHILGFLDRRYLPIGSVATE